jgi:membrane-bound lytic murein transglycosylase A
LTRLRAAGFALMTAMSFGMQSANAGDVLKPVSFSNLKGWDLDDHAAALLAFRRSCAEIKNDGTSFKRALRYSGAREDWIETCQAADEARDAKAFFEQHFVACVIEDDNRPDGLLTGYFEPAASGSLHRTDEFLVPVYGKPTDLVAFDPAQQTQSGFAYGRIVNGKPVAYYTRGEIEDGVLDNRGLELLWLSSRADLFFMQVQGSGRVLLEDGTEIRLSYAAKTGRPYTAIGGVLIDRGVLTRKTNSMQAIREWMSNNPKDADALMRLNESYVFFRTMQIVEPHLGAVGAQHIPLTPERSLAVDRSIWAFGTPIWIETELPPEATDPDRQYRRLMIAQDTGSAIKGAARGDVYWGWGDRAALIAGHMKSPARMVALLPKAVAQTLGLTPASP